MRRPAPPVPLRTFQLLALAGLVPAGAVVAWLGPDAAAWLAPLDPEHSALLSVLAYALVALVCVLGWALLLLPMRARTELGPLRQDWDEIRERGGLVRALRDEQQKIDAAAVSADPATRRRYYAQMAAAGVAVTALVWLFAWALWSDGELGLYGFFVAVVAPGVTLWYAVRYLALRVLRLP